MLEVGKNFPLLTILSFCPYKPVKPVQTVPSLVSFYKDWIVFPYETQKQPI